MHITPLGPSGPGWMPPQPTRAAGPVDTFQAQPGTLGVARALFDPGATERWRVPLPFSFQNRPTTDAEGRLYMSSQAGRMQRLDPATGKPVWTFREGRYLTDPAFTPDGKVLVVRDMRHVHVLDPATGEGEHQVDLDHSTLSPPAAGPNNLLVMLGGDGLVDKNWSVYAVDPAVKPRKNLLKSLLSFMPHHGTVHQWEVKVGERHDLLPIPMTPKGELHRLVSLPNGSLAVTIGDREVLALDPATGQEAWRQELPGRGLYDPVPVGQDEVLLAGPEKLSFLDAGTGAVRREQEAGGVLFSQPTADRHGNVFYFTGLDRLHVVRPDGAGWSKKGDFDTQLSPVQDDEGHVFVVQGGALYALDAETGEAGYRLECRGKISSSPALLPDGALAVKVRTGSGLDEELVCLQNPARAAVREEEPAPAVQESVAWVRLGGVRLKKKA